MAAVECFAPAEGHSGLVSETMSGEQVLGVSLMADRCVLQVHKFGGTCVSAAERIASAAQLVLKGAQNGEQQVCFGATVMDHCRSRLSLLAAVISCPDNRCKCAVVFKGVGNATQQQQRNLSMAHVWHHAGAMRSCCPASRASTVSAGTLKNRAHAVNASYGASGPRPDKRTKSLSPPQVVVVSAMGSHPSSPIKVTDLLLNMVAKAQRQDEAFLLDLAALQVSRGCHSDPAVRVLGEDKVNR